MKKKFKRKRFCYIHFFFTISLNLNRGYKTNVITLRHKRSTITSNDEKNMVMSKETCYSMNSCSSGSKIIFFFMIFFCMGENASLAHMSRRLKWGIVIAHRPSSVRRRRPSSVRKLSHFQLLFQNRLMDFDETW